MIGFRLAVGFAIVVGFTGCGSDQDAATNPVMPGVVGLQLDVALSDVERAGFEDEVEVLSGGVFGVVDESNWQVCEQLPAAGEAVTETPRLTVDRSCPDVATEPDVAASEVTEPEPVDTEAAAAPTVPATDVSTEQPSDGAEPEQAPYTYVGPLYEIVASDRLPIGLDEYFVLIDKLDYSTDAYKDQVKLVITDVARTQGTAELNVNVVTDIEIALVESFSTAEDFYAEKGDDYVNNVVLPKEATDWVAAYSGGFDYDTAELSNSDDAYEVIWFPYGSEDIEKWKPE